MACRFSGSFFFVFSSRGADLCSLALAGTGLGVISLVRSCAYFDPTPRFGFDANLIYVYGRAIIIIMHTYKTRKQMPLTLAPLPKRAPSGRARVRHIELRELRAQSK